MKQNELLKSNTNELIKLMNECRTYQRQYESHDYRLVYQQEQIKKQSQQTTIQLVNCMKILTDFIDDISIENQLFEEKEEETNEIINEIHQFIDSNDYSKVLNKLRFLYQKDQFVSQSNQLNESDKMKHKLSEKLIKQNDNKTIELYPLPIDHLYWNYLKEIISQINTFERFKHFVSSLCKRNGNDFVFIPRNKIFFETQLLPFLTKQILSTSFSFENNELERPQMMKIYQKREMKKSTIVYLLSCSLFGLNELFHEEYISQEYQLYMKEYSQYQSLSQLFFIKSTKSQLLLDSIISYLETIYINQNYLEETICYVVANCNLIVNENMLKEIASNDNQFIPFDSKTYQKYHDFDSHIIKTICVKKDIGENIFSEYMNIETELFLSSPECFFLLFLCPQLQQSNIVKIEHISIINSLISIDSQTETILLKKKEKIQQYQYPLYFFTRFDYSQSITDQYIRENISKELIRYDQLLSMTSKINESSNQTFFLFSCDEMKENNNDILLQYLLLSLLFKSSLPKSLFILNEQDVFRNEMIQLQQYFQHNSFSFQKVKNCLLTMKQQQSTKVLSFNDYLQLFSKK